MDHNQKETVGDWDIPEKCPSGFRSGSASASFDSGEKNKSEGRENNKQEKPDCCSQM